MPKWLYQSLSDENLMRAYARGRCTAFDCLYARHRLKLFAFLRHQCGNDAIAEELSQDAWMAVIRRAKAYSPTAKFTTWLFHIAQNRLVDHWRKFGPTANVITQELDESLCTQDKALESLVTQEMFAALNGLPAEQLTTLLLKIEGFSRKEIAEITSVKAETVKSRLRYAKNHLRELAQVQS